MYNLLTIMCLSYHIGIVLVPETPMFSYHQFYGPIIYFMKIKLMNEIKVQANKYGN